MRSPHAERKEKTFLCFFLSEKHGFGRGRGEPHNCCCALRPAREIKVDIPPEPKHNRARCSQRCFYILYSMIFLVKILSPRRWWSRALRTTFASMRCFARNEQNMGERSATSEPHRSCYVSRARNEARVQRGRSEAKK